MGSTCHPKAAAVAISRNVRGMNRKAVITYIAKMVVPTPSVSWFSERSQSIRYSVID